MSFYKNDYDKKYWKPGFYADDEVLEGHEYWINEQLRIQDKYVCDCERDYGKDCLYPEKYKSGGCR